MSLVSFTSSPCLLQNSPSTIGLIEEDKKVDNDNVPTSQSFLAPLTTEIHFLYFDPLEDLKLLSVVTKKGRQLSLDFNFAQTEARSESFEIFSSLPPKLIRTKSDSVKARQRAIREQLGLIETAKPNSALQRLKAFNNQYPLNSLEEEVAPNSPLKDFSTYPFDIYMGTLINRPRRIQGKVVLITPQVVDAGEDKPISSRVYCSLALLQAADKAFRLRDLAEPNNTIWRPNKR
jgi:hypothetical protein